MGNEEKIVETLSTLQNRGICDDCLEVAAGVRSRQQVYQIASRLAKQGHITRKRGDCEVRQVGVTHGSKEKLLNYATGRLKSRLPKAESASIEAQTDELSQWLFDGMQFLNRIEKVSSSREPFAARIARLLREGKVDRPLSAQMQLINTYRVKVVKERIPLDFEDWSIAVRTIEKTRSDWKNRLLR
jgi:hypothetical protein